jgi:hypothetical protein
MKKTSCQLYQVLPAVFRPNLAANTKQDYGGTTSFEAFFGIAVMWLIMSIHNARSITGVRRKVPSHLYKLTVDSTVLVLRISQLYCSFH